MAKRLSRWRWVLLAVAAELAALIAVAWVLSAPATITTGSAPSIAGSILGVHTRLTDEVEDVKIRRTTLMAREMGAGWVVELFPWAYIEPQPGHYDWQHADMVVAAANAQGLAVVARLDYVPAWARPKDSTPRFLDEDRYADYARFVQAFAARYRGSVRYFAIWNEPNTSFEWGYRPPNPESYTRLLAASYQAIKAVDPEAVVLPAGMAPTLEESNLGLNDLTYLQRMYAAGAGKYFDAMNVHAYGWKLPPDDPASPDKINFARVELVREVMVQNGDSGKPIIITEAGWNDHPRWSKAVRPAQRTEYTLRALEKARDEWPYVEAINIWVFRLPAPARNYNDYFTLLDPEFRPKPIYEALKEAASRGAFTARQVAGQGATPAR